MALPAVGDSGLASYVDLVVREAVNDPRRIQWAKEVDENLALYLGYHYIDQPQLGRKRVTVNRVQKAVNGIWANIASEPPKFVFSTNVTDDEPSYYINNELIVDSTPVLQSLLSQLPPDTYQKIKARDGSINYPRQLNDQEVAFVKQFIAQGQELKRQIMMGIAPQSMSDQIIPPEVLYKVNNKSRAEALQTIFEAMWEYKRGSRIWRENTLYTLISGIRPTLYEFDDAHKYFCLRNVDPRHVYIDPIASDIADADWVALDQPVSADTIKEKYPYLADKVDAFASAGSLVWAGYSYYNGPTAYRNITFGRPMIVMRTVWFRYQKYPLDLEQALQSGLVVQQQTQAQDMAETPAQEASEDSQQQAVEASQGTEMPIGSSGGVEAPQNPNMAVSYVLAETGEPTDPSAKNWPMRDGIRQIRMIATDVIDDRECEFRDIPIALNVNIPIDNSPLGQGEPQRLSGMQYALNDLISDVVTHFHYSTFPTRMMAKSLLNTLSDPLRNMGAMAGQIIGVPDEVLTSAPGRNLQDLIATYQTPRLDPDLFRQIESLLSKLDDEGNQSEVMNGSAPANTSGEAIGKLQNAASRVLAIKAQRGEDYLIYIAKLAIHSIITRLTPEDWKKLFQKPIQILYALKDDIDWETFSVCVKVKGGSAASEESETQTLMAMRQQGMRIPDSMIMEREDIDPTEAVDKWTREQQEKASAQQPVMQAQPQTT